MAELIARLMSHYWTASDPPAIRQAQIEDWIEDLDEFPVDAVAAACREWRQTQSRRPTPSEIRRMVMAEMRRHKSVEAMFDGLVSKDSIRKRCAGRYGTCDHRLSVAGFVCFDECKARIASGLSVGLA